MKINNLVLVHSFPTNSVVLAGLVGFFEKYFKVYPIDLPGFTPNVPPLKKISLRGYRRFLKREVKRLKLNSYVLGGISFGFVVVNTSKLDKKCRGVLAIEPYINEEGLKMAGWEKGLYRLGCRLIWRLKIADKAWNEKLFTRLGVFVKQNRKTRRAIFDLIEGETFFKTLEELLNYRGFCRFHKVPYVLVINPNDERIKADLVINLFEKRVEKLMIIKTKIPHFPSEMTEKYFEEEIGVEGIKKAVSFFD